MSVLGGMCEGVRREVTGQAPKGSLVGQGEGEGGLGGKEGGTRAGTRERASQTLMSLKLQEKWTGRGEPRGGRLELDLGDYTSRSRINIDLCYRKGLDLLVTIFISLDAG